MSYEQRQASSGTRKLLLEEQSGRRNELYVRVVTNYERNTDANSSGDYRPTTGKDKDGNNLPRSLIYFEVPKDDPRIKRAAESGGTLRINGQLQNANYLKHTISGVGGRQYLLGGIMDQNGKVLPTGVAGPALRNNFANYNAGKPGSDFTKNSLALGQLSASTDAGLEAIDSGQRKLGDRSVIPGTAGLSQGTREEIEKRRKGTDPASTADKKGDEPPAANLVTSDPVVITKNKGVLGFEDRPSKQFRYPLAMVDSQTDYLLISVQEYTPAGTGSGSRGPIRSRGQLDSNTASGANKTYAGSIILPIPSNIQDGNSVKYGDSSLDSVTAAVAGASIGIMESGGKFLNNPSAAVEDIKKSVEGAANELGGMGGDLSKLLTKNLSAQAASLVGLSNVTGQQLLARETGGILNPNQELLFSGVTLRSFRFSFKMNPRNENEAREIKSIIRVFKSNMAAKTTTSGVFLSTPNVFDLTYMSGDKPHPFLHVFKTCALTDMSVNYTGDGLYATYGGKEKTPISMVMDLTFKELEAIYDEDYEKIEQGVGY